MNTTNEKTWLTSQTPKELFDILEKSESPFTHLGRIAIELARNTPCAHQRRPFDIVPNDVRNALSNAQAFLDGKIDENTIQTIYNRVNKTAANLAINARNSKSTNPGQIPCLVHCAATAIYLACLNGAITENGFPLLHEIQEITAQTAVDDLINDPSFLKRHKELDKIPDKERCYVLACQSDLIRSAIKVKNL